MIKNILSPCVKIPFDRVKGTVAQRQEKAQNFVDTLYSNISGQFTDNYSSMSYKQLQENIENIIGFSDFKVIVQQLSEKQKRTCEAICEVLFNKDRDIKAISIGLAGVANSIRAGHLPEVMHEVLHLGDDIFHPKYLTRLQKLYKKGLSDKKYDSFYEKNFYCTEAFETEEDKKDILKIIKNRTKKFLKRFTNEERIDYLQDMRYSLMSEINAYKTEQKVAQDLRNKGFLIKDFSLEDFPKSGLFEEKIKLLNDLLLNYIMNERRAVKPLAGKAE